MTRQNNSFLFLIYKIFGDHRLYWGIGFLYLGFVTFASLRPIPLVTQNDLPDDFKFSLELFLDKILHLGAYVCAGLWFRGLTSQTKKLLIALTLFGVSMEVGQYFIPTRSFELLDMVANFTGVSIGILVASKLNINWQRYVLRTLPKIRVAP